MTIFYKFWFLFVAGFFPALFLVAASYAGCNRPLVVISFIVAMGFLGNYFPGLRVNALDLSPNYAASIISIVNGAGSLTGILVPAFVGFMTPDVRPGDFLFPINCLCWRKYFIYTRLIISVNTRAMENSFLGCVCCGHGENCDLFNLGIRRCSTME